MQQSHAVPEVRAKIRGQGCGVASQENSDNYESQQSGDLRKGKDVLDERARLYAENVDHRERDDHEDGHQILRANSHVHVAHNYRRSDMNGGNLEQMKQPMSGGD